MPVVDRNGQLHFDVYIDGKPFRFNIKKFVVPRLKKGQTFPKSAREAERQWLGELENCVRRGEDPRQPPPRESGGGTIAEFIEQVYTPTMKREKRRSPETRESNLRMLLPIIGHLSLQTLDSDLPSELVKDKYAVEGPDAYAVGTRNKLLRRVSHLTSIAIRKRLLKAASPFRTGEVKVSKTDEMVRTRRLYEGEEERLLNAALTYEKSGTGNRKLTIEAVKEIRRRVKKGDRQNDVAWDFKISTGLCNQIVKGIIWNPSRAAKNAGTGQSFYDLIIGALEIGARQGQLMLIQNHYVNWKTLRIHLPASEDKSLLERDIPFDPDGRLGAILQKRRFIGGPHGYVFGTAKGEYRPFPRGIWENIVLLANDVVVDRPKGRKGQLSEACIAAFQRIDLHWHDLRRECGSRWYVELHFNLVAVMTALGHKSLLTTQKYLHIEDDQTDAAFREAFARRAEKSPTKIPQNGVARKVAGGVK